MKKLLVLAALSAMAMGAQATYTFNLDGAKAVYLFTQHEDDMGRDFVINSWEGGASMLFNKPEEFATWEDFYKMVDAGLSVGKFSGSDGSFALEGATGSQTLGFFVLTDATEISPSAAYTAYHGTCDLEGGAISIEGDPIASGFLMPGAPTPAPEPTSGLLLLLGVAGLALKRKRA